MLIFCSPHNPVGRVWTENELLDLADLCRRKDVMLISDEIHADLVYPGHRHIPWLSLPPDRRPRSMALVSPTKSFNIPGLNTAYAIVPDPELRRRIQSMLTSLGIGNGSSSPLSYTAAEAAWTGGGDWLDSLLVYLAGNDSLMRDFFRTEVPEVKFSDLEGTYLEWLNLSETGRTDEELWTDLLDAGVWLSRGTQFGRGGEGMMRMNIACPRSQLEQGLERIARALTRTR
jgi:cystathionine beta-lyase